jgi:hypothetical protein
MQISELRRLVRDESIAFAWGQWAQIGVFADTDRRDNWVVDPEALLLFTLEIARHDPRLFDEVLDWLRENERAISVQRLKNLSRDDADRELVAAALGWVSRYRKNPRFTRSASNAATDPLEPLFPLLSRRVPNPDPAFLESGLAKPDSVPSRKSTRPRLDAPINFAFRMRELFGVSSRAEIVRYLLTAPAPDVSAQLVAEATAYAKRNVFQSLSALTAAGVVQTFTVANERRYSMSTTLWQEVLTLAELPRHRDWPQLLWAIRRIARVLEQSVLDEASEYMLASAARDLMQEVEESLRFAGVPVVGGHRPGAEYWSAFAETVQLSLNVLREGHP